MNLTQDLTWVKSHVVTLVLAAFLVCGSVYGVLYVQTKARSEAAQQQAVIAAAITASNTALQTSTKQQVDALIEDSKQKDAQITVLISALSKRQVVENNLPKQNATLSATQVAQQLGGVAQGDDVVLPLSNAQSVLTAVQLVPLLQKEKSDLQATNGLLQTEVSNGVQALNLERTAHKSDNDANAAIIKGKDLDILAIKAQARKSKMKWFGIGVVVGFIGRGFAGF